MLRELHFHHTLRFQQEELRLDATPFFSQSSLTFFRINFDEITSMQHGFQGADVYNFRQVYLQCESVLKISLNVDFDLVLPDTTNF